MPACMHPALVLGGKLQASGLMHWQCINVSPQGYDWLPLANPANHSSLGKWILVRHAQLVQVLPDAGAGVVLLVHQFRELVQLPPDLLEPGLEALGRQLQCIHIHSTRPMMVGQQADETRGQQQ